MLPRNPLFCRLKTEIELLKRLDTKRLGVLWNVPVLPLTTSELPWPIVIAPELATALVALSVEELESTRPPPLMVVAPTVRVPLASVRTPAPSFSREPVPERPAVKVELLERLKTRAALFVILPVIEPVVPPLPMETVPLEITRPPAFVAEPVRESVPVPALVRAALPVMVPEISSAVPRAPVVRAALRIVLPEPESEPMVSAALTVKLPEFATAAFAETPPLVLRPAPLAMEIAVLARVPSRPKVPVLMVVLPV